MSISQPGMHLTQKANLSALKIEVNLFFGLPISNKRETLSKQKNKNIISYSGGSKRLKVPALRINRIKTAAFWQSAAHTIAAFSLGTVKGLVCSFDDLMRSRV